MQASNNIDFIDDDVSQTQLIYPANYQARDYQLGLWEARANPDINRYVMVWHRRAGKDITTFSFVVAEAIEHVGYYLYFLPKKTQARKVIWNAQDKYGVRFLDRIPPGIEKRRKEDEMLIEFQNGSIIQLTGSDDFNSVMGTNPRGIVFSEWSISNPVAWDYMRPIVVENGGWALFNYTPRGRNHGYFTYKMALEQARREHPSWFVSRLTIDDTGVVTPEQVEQEISEGMAEERAKQEFYCSFDGANAGAIWGADMSKAYSEKRVGHFPPEPGLPVYTFWDIGVDHDNAIWFLQFHHGGAHVVHYYGNNNKSLAHYANYVKEWAKKHEVHFEEHWGPHDLMKRDYTSEQLDTIADIAKKDYGINFKIVPKEGIVVGIEAGRELIRKAFFHEAGCEDGISCLIDYQYEYDEEKKCFNKKPLQNWATDGADAWRYAAVVARRIFEKQRRSKTGIDGLRAQSSGFDVFEI